MSMRNIPEGYAPCPLCGVFVRGAHVCGKNEGRFQAVRNPVTPSLVVEVPRKDKVSPRKMNTAERRFYDTFKGGFDLLLPQCLLLPLDGGGVYRADFFGLDAGEWFVVEIKGGYAGPGWEQGIERYRRARAQYERHFNFELYSWDSKAKKWEVER